MNSIDMLARCMTLQEPWGMQPNWKAIVGRKSAQYLWKVYGADDQTVPVPGPHYPLWIIQRKEMGRERWYDTFHLMSIKED